MVWDKLWRSKSKQTRKYSQDITRNSNKEEDLKSWVDIPRLPHASGNRMLQNLKDFNSMPFLSKIEYLCATAKFYHPIEKGTTMLQLLLMMTDGENPHQCAENVQRPETERIQGHTHRLMQNKKLVLSEILGLLTEFPKILRMDFVISRGHERFVNENHRHNSDIVNCSSSLRTKKENLNNVCSESSKPAVVNHKQGSRDSNDVKTKVEPSSVHRETVASTIRVACSLD